MHTWISLGRPGGYPGGRPGSKTLVRPRAQSFQMSLMFKCFGCAKLHLYKPIQDSNSAWELGLSGTTMGPKVITHFYYLGINFPITQGICYTGLSGGRLHKVLPAKAPITHIECLGINFSIALTTLTHNNCF